MIPLTGIGAVFLLINVLMILLLPKRWAAMPLLVAACYMPLGQGIQIGPFHFPVLRLIILSGLLRTLLKNERPVNGLNSMDRLFVAWSLWALVSSFFHDDPSSTLVFNLGLIFNVCGIFFLFRTFCENQDNVVQFCRITIIVLLVVAVEMIYEQLASHNLFSLFGGIREVPDVRNGRTRAQGPFAHSILAGTVGAVCLPFTIGLWQQFRILSVAGILACTIIVFTSASSGPLMSAIFAIGALLLWPCRHMMKTIKRAAVLGYLVAELIMKAPAYYVLAHIDLTGSSSGWHRARLIESTIEHFDEWWLGGTDYTRHWMPTGVSWSEDHTDITNHYIQMGVFGGLPLILLFIATLWSGFTFVGNATNNESGISAESKFFFWALGSSLFAHAATMFSVSYFDQSFIFIYFDLAAVVVLDTKIPQLQDHQIQQTKNQSMKIRYSRPKIALSKK